LPLDSLIAVVLIEKNKKKSLKCCKITKIYYKRQNFALDQINFLSNIENLKFPVREKYTANS